jgi:UDP-glucose 4-epimerase
MNRPGSLSHGADTARGYPDVLVWGACGFIGRRLVSTLLRRGARVSVLTRSRDRYPKQVWRDDVEWFELHGDGRDAFVIDQAVSGAAVIFNLAGSTGAAQSNRGPIESLDANNRAQLELLEACRRSSHLPHVVFSSSRLVYGRPVTARVDEDHPRRPASVYAAHKLCCEHYHAIYSSQGAISSTIVRVSNAFGYDEGSLQKPHGLLNAFVQQALAGRPLTIFGDGSQLRDFIYIDDLTEVLVRCGERESARNETFNIGSGVGISLRHAAERIVTALGGPPIVYAPWPLDYAVVETGDYVTEIAKATRLLDFTPHWSFDEGLGATLDAVRAPQRVQTRATA